jgi:hypothetical protein
VLWPQGGRQTCALRVADKPPGRDSRRDTRPRHRFFESAPSTARPRRPGRQTADRHLYLSPNVLCAASAAGRSAPRYFCYGRTINRARRTRPLHRIAVDGGTRRTHRTGHSGSELRTRQIRSTRRGRSGCLLVGLSLLLGRAECTHSSGSPALRRPSMADCKIGFPGGRQLVAPGEFGAFSKRGRSVLCRKPQQQRPGGRAPPSASAASVSRLAHRADAGDCALLFALPQNCTRTPTVGARLMW